MHVQHSVHINRPIAECQAALAEASSTWFPRLKANQKSSVGVKLAGVPLRKGVSVEIGEPAKAGDWTNVPVSWTATGPRALFPVMSGRIELVPAGKDETRLTVSGMYEPPLGKLGEELDHAVMHNVAEATVKDLAESIAERLKG
jgi:hypothetical protein